MDNRVRLLFVCLGNICRSPTAEAVMEALRSKHALDDHIAIDSAGTGSWHAGELADARSRQAARQRGIEIRSRARKVVIEDFQQFDYLLAMDRSNRDDLLAMAPDQTATERVFLFRSFDKTAEPEAEVPDPYYGGESGFDQVLDMCERAADGLLAHLRDKHGLVVFGR